MVHVMHTIFVQQKNGILGKSCLFSRGKILSNKSGTTWYDSLKGHTRAVQI